MCPSEDQQRVGLERDLQAALRNQIQQIEPGMTIIDEGVERRVDSGFIDITARDSSGALCYIGDVFAEEEDCKVRGSLSLPGFEARGGQPVWLRYE